MRASDALGSYGEQVAVTHLLGRGMTVLARNWRCELGELDIVARDGDTLVVCEVKTRAGTGFGSPHEAVTAAKAARLHRLAERWIDDHGVRPPEVRIDVIAVLRPRRGAATLEHVQGIVA